MPEFTLEYGSDAAATRYKAADPFTRGYLEAAFFTNTGTRDDEGLENAALSMLSDDAWNDAARDCAKFQVDNAATLEAGYGHHGYDDTMAGRDFWYTRNGHGVGFWCRDELEPAGDVADKLTEACKAWRETDMYLGDDGLIYFS